MQVYGQSFECTFLSAKQTWKAISYLINTHCASNVNGFINSFRVEAVIRKLGDPKEQHKTVLALALESGFNSKSTFNQVFRQHTGKSPSQYLLVQK
ncbi:AraC family transcriptional regulator [Dyadobacter sp. CY326]|uniref:helix-turn-helix domain-containing protein n=1 Tax=Dyadobacter sp. CY326 TaxID=2907300 RepID=UPI001F1CC4BA|nr:helix-turn-helix domain-containing protein [Dyadobacter sp. CY326]MCE7064554.1 helix-turn-helix domain-containing protein [Dyadobacter sp. CY326]